MKKILITGGTSGIGLAVAKRMIDDGNENLGDWTQSPKIVFERLVVSKL